MPFCTQYLACPAKWSLSSGMDCNGEYGCRTKLVPLSDVANLEKKVPLEWITPDGCYVTQEFIDYALPLIHGEPKRIMEHSMPRYARLKKIPVE